MQTEEMEAREQGMARSQFVHHGWRQQGKPTMDGPIVNTEAEGLEEQDAEAEAVISVSTSTEAMAQELKPQDAATGTPTQIR